MRRVPKKRAAPPPPPIKIAVPQLDTAGLRAAYDWLPADRTVGFRLALEWFDKAMPVLLFRDPLDPARQRRLDLAVKARRQGEGTPFMEERATAWTTAIRLIEKTWPNKFSGGGGPLPSVDAALANTQASRYVLGCAGVLKILNDAFGPEVKFGVTVGQDREAVGTDVLLPISELERMVPMTPARFVVPEAVTVARTLSIARDEEGNEVFDGQTFLTTALPEALGKVAAWTERSAGGSLAKPVGKAPAPASTPTTGKPRTAQAGRRPGRIDDTLTIRILGAFPPGRKGLSGDSLAALSKSGGKTVKAFKASLAYMDKGHAGYSSWYGNWAVKFAVDKGLVSLV